VSELPKRGQADRATDSTHLSACLSSAQLAKAANRDGRHEAAHVGLRCPARQRQHAGSSRASYSASGGGQGMTRVSGPPGPSGQSPPSDDMLGSAGSRRRAGETVRTASQTKSTERLGSTALAWAVWSGRWRRPLECRPASDRAGIPALLSSADLALTVITPTRSSSSASTARPRVRRVPKRRRFHHRRG
jgi:hypothetical protein